MDRQVVERAVIGFLVGGVMGLGFNYLFMWLFNLISSWIGREPVQFTWQSGIPLALLMGLSLAINMAHPPFGD